MIPYGEPKAYVERDFYGDRVKIHLATTAETWRERRIREKQARLRATRRSDGCLCDTGPIIVATWSGPFSTLTVALEHRHYCPIPDVPYTTQMLTPPSEPAAHSGN